MTWNPKKERERQIEHETRRCQHFTGIRHDTCKAGVVYLQVRVDRDKIPTGVPFGFPCMQEEIRTCSRREYPSREEAERYVDEREAYIKATLAKMNRGICATCGDESTDWKQSGPCIYYVPCGHRVGQGSAKKYKAGVLKERASGQHGK